MTLCRTPDCRRAAKPYSPWCVVCFGALVDRAMGFRTQRQRFGLA